MTPDREQHGPGTSEDASIDEEGVRWLAAAAGLPLAEERLALVATLLNAWLPPANELSRTMSALELREHMPIIRSPVHRPHGVGDGRRRRPRAVHH